MSQVRVFSGNLVGPIHVYGRHRPRLVHTHQPKPATPQPSHASGTTRIRGALGRLNFVFAVSVNVELGKLPKETDDDDGSRLVSL